jgi:excisionase family DNA binding protein
MNSPEYITMALTPFFRAAGIGRTKVYELIAAGEIKSVTVGKKRLIVVQSYLDFLARQAENAPVLVSPNPRAGSRISALPRNRTEANRTVAHPLPAAARTERPRGRPSGRG